MDKDTACRLLRSWLTAWALSLGSCRCIGDCFRLDVPRELVWLCCLLALGSTGAMALPGSRKVLLPLGALAVGYFSRQIQVRTQFLGVLRQIMNVFHRAYGWKAPEPASVSGDGFFPWLVLASLLSLAVGYSVCRRKKSWLPILLAGGSVALCAMAPDPEPPEWALFLLLESMGVLLFTAQVRQQHPRQENRLGLAAALALGVFLGGILWLVPKESYVNRSEALRQRLDLAAGQMPGEVGNALTLLLQNASRAPREISLSRLGPRQPEDTPVLTVTAGSSGPLYLRQRHYDSYDGKTWTASPRQTETPTPLGQGEPVSIRTREVQPLLLLPQPCGEGLTLTGGASENSAGLTQYTLLRGKAVAPLPENGLQLPEATREILAERFPEGLSPEGIAELLQGGQYTLSPEAFSPENGDFALWFLENGMEGYCVHFAATAAVLLRSCGIPARLVTGYLVRTEAGIPATVTQGHAHAWAEYYDPESGCWEILEATPSREEERLSAPAASPEKVPQEVSEAIPGNRKAPWLWAALWLLSAAMLAVWLRGILRRGRLRRCGVNARALCLWQEAQRLSRLLGELPPGQLHNLAQKARFSPHLLTEDELAEFDTYFRYCRSQLRKNSFLKRLVLACFHGVY